MYIKQLLNKKTVKSFKEIKKGWSADKKYYIETENHKAFLLRASSIEKLDRKKLEFEHMQKAYALGIPMSKPLEFKVINNQIYSLFTWMRGNDAEKTLPTFNKKEQYRLGVESGKLLKKIHVIPAPQNIEKWEDTFNRKIDRNINNYQMCDLKYEKGHLFLEYIENNRHLIKDRPQTFQHGDYHTGNMILSSENELKIIDFNRWSYGDPWEEFNRIDFTATLSPMFATGQLDGYFGGEPPIAFFELLALYIAANTLNALPWALIYSNQEVETMRKKAASVLNWYDEMQEVIPKWYEKDANLKYGEK